MEAFTNLFATAPAFRVGVTRLVQLPEATLLRLAEVDDLTALGTDDFEDLGISDPIAVRALDTIMNMAAAERAQAGDVAEAVLSVFKDPEGEYAAKRKTLESLFTMSSEYIRAVLRDRSLRTIFPVLEGTVTSVDMRLTADDEDNGVLVPLISVRMVFDETIGGSEAVSFQMSEQTARQVVESIEAALVAIQEASKALGAN